MTSYYKYLSFTLHVVALELISSINFCEKILIESSANDDAITNSSTRMYFIFLYAAALFCNKVNIYN